MPRPATLTRWPGSSYPSGRGLDEWVPFAREHLDDYREALLIFYGKASVYLHAMERPFPGH